MNSDYSYFGALTVYEKSVVDRLRKEKISDKEILMMLNEM